MVVIVTIAIPSALVVPLSGCGSFGSSTPPSFAVSGNVTFDNKPVPEGTIQFKPDFSNGNTGPTASAKIQDGKYEIPKSKGLPSGMMIVEISGNEAGGGASLFSDYRTEVELPEENAQQDFDVPSATASGKK
ncbi:MAG TPA: hypothetical protein VNQ76_13350 [Planctomicrobium sp.]|nr:hypothetical protein [Planctomicrobium sp.]